MTSRIAGLVIVAVVAVLAGCSTTDAPSGAAASTTMPSAPTTTTSTTEPPPIAQETIDLTVAPSVVGAIPGMVEVTVTGNGSDGPLAVIACPGVHGLTSVDAWWEYDGDAVAMCDVDIEEAAATGAWREPGVTLGAFSTTLSVTIDEQAIDDGGVVIVAGPLVSMGGPPIVTAAGTALLEIDAPPFPPPEEVESAAQAYCAAWPDVSEQLDGDSFYAAVSDGGWDETTDRVVAGHEAVMAALAATSFITIDCGGPAAVAGDWIALPVSASRADGSGEEGIWVLRLPDGRITWHLTYGTAVDVVAPAPTGVDPVIDAESRAYCDLFAGTGDRDTDAILDAMTDDPGIHSLTSDLHYPGVAGVKRNMTQVMDSDIIVCGEIGTTHGQWSAGGSTVDNSEFTFFIVGMNVMQHIDGKIHRQYAHFSQLSGPGGWGLPVDD